VLKILFSDYHCVASVGV